MPLASTFTIFVLMSSCLTAFSLLECGMAKPAPKLATMSPSGQVVIPKKFREQTRLQPGPVQMELVPEGVLIRPVRIELELPPSRKK